MNNDKASPFIFLDPVIPPIFAGRKDELRLIHQALFQEKESLVIFGNDAIGKSSIVSTLYLHMNEKKNAKIFPVRINAFDFRNAIESNFLGITTHQICAAVWTKLLKRDYSELIENSLSNSPQFGFTTPEEKSISRIFRIVTSEKFTGSGKISNEMGGKFILEGKMSQSHEFINERKALAPFEFLHLLDELNGISNAFGYESIMVFCDELNHFPEKTNSDILRNYFSVFSSKKIQFVIIIVNPDELHKDDAFRIIESFNYKLEIDVFKHKEDVRELVENVLNSGHHLLSHEEGSMDYLFTVTNGHPWWIQKVCDLTFQRITKRKQGIIRIEDLEDAYGVFIPEIEIYRDRVGKGLPFRKYDLRNK